VRVRTGETDLHSGFFGGAAMNAAHALLHTLAGAAERWDELLDGVVPPSEAELASWEKLDGGATVLTRQGAVARDALAEDEFYLRTLGLPAVDVHGIRCGEADLPKTIVPVEAVASLSVRLAPEQSPADVAATVERILREAAPAGARIEVERRALTPPVLIDRRTPAIGIGLAAFRSVFGVVPLIVRTGGSLPIMAALAERGIPTILTGLDVHEGNAHAPNERLLLEHLLKGIDAAKATLTGLAALPAGADSMSRNSLWPPAARAYSHRGRGQIPGETRCE
jgi:acetylornithine deacetylase/succinyl-diaminopimelate desuccinylase-like protein